MYIKITAEIVELARKNKNSRAYEVLKMLDWCVYQGHHFVHGDAELLVQVNRYFKNDFLFLSKLFAKYPINSDIASKMLWHLEFVTEHSKNPKSRKDETNHTIYVNIDSSFEVYRECHLLAENLEDIRMFEYILAYYKRVNKLQKAHSSYYRLLGGGSTTKDVYESDVLFEKALVLCIVDSDKHYPNAGIGNTARQLQCIENKHAHPFNSFYYIMEGVLEIENLVPYKIYEDYSNGKSELNEAVDAIRKVYSTDRNLLAYYDYKNGITPDLLLDNNPSNNAEEIARMITPNLDSIIANVQKSWDDTYKYLQTIVYLTPQDRDRIFKQSKKGDYYVPGLGNKILTHILDTQDNGLNKIVPEDLSDAQQLEYDNIGSILYNWTCASEPIRI